MATTYRDTRTPHWSKRPRVPTDASPTSRFQRRRSSHLSQPSFEYVEARRNASAEWEEEMRERDTRYHDSHEPLRAYSPPRSHGRTTRRDDDRRGRNKRYHSRRDVPHHRTPSPPRPSRRSRSHLLKPLGVLIGLTVGMFVIAAGVASQSRATKRRERDRPAPIWRDLLNDLERGLAEFDRDVDVPPPVPEVPIPPEVDSWPPSVYSESDIGDEEEEEEEESFHTARSSLRHASGNVGSLNRGVTLPATVPDIPAGDQTARGDGCVGPDRECNVCGDEKPAEEFLEQITTRCFHDVNTCRDCLGQWIRTSLQSRQWNEIPCAEMDCNEICAYEDIIRIAPLDVADT